MEVELRNIKFHQDEEVIGFSAILYIDEVEVANVVDDGQNKLHIEILDTTKKRSEIKIKLMKKLLKHISTLPKIKFSCCEDMYENNITNYLCSMAEEIFKKSNGFYN